MTNENDKEWEQLIVDFLQSKFDTDLIKFIKETFKEIQKLASKSKEVSEEFEAFLDARKNKKPDHLTETDFQKARMIELFEYLDEFSLVDKIQLASEYQAMVEKITAKYHINTWIEDASDNASSVTFATHVSKLTHSKIDSSSLNDAISSARDDLLTTSSLPNPIVDGAVAGNQYAPIYQFLSLEINGVTLAQALAEPSNTILQAFAKNDAQLSEWNKHFKEVTQASTLSTHFLAKQVYFPINTEQDQYHLLCHMVSSSLAQHIFGALFNDENKQIRNQYFDKKYHSEVFYDFPAKATLAVTASNHSNASQLNGRRGGKLYLFNTQPPIWQSQTKPPANETNLFNHYLLNQMSRDNINGFCAMFLGAIEVYRKPNIMQGLEKWLQAITDDVIAYASTVQQLPAEWSINSELEANRIEHCYFLDIDRQDETFITAQRNNEWQSVVARDFGQWINNKLSSKGKNFTPQPEHRKLWQKFFSEHLRDYMNIVLIDDLTKESEVL